MEEQLRVSKNECIFIDSNKNQKEECDFPDDYITIKISFFIRKDKTTR